MRQPSMYGLMLPFLVLFISLVSPESQAQSKRSIDWNTDTIAASAASSSATKFRSDLNNAGKKATKIISLPVDKLKEIMDACAANGVTDIKVLIVTLRVEDTAQYSKHNPGMTASEKKDIIGRQTIVIRVPRKAFGSGESGSRIIIPGKSSLMLSLLTAGMLVIDKPSEVPYGADDIFFEFGSICPPPTSCDN
jgi:hypothetical protein